MTNEIVQRLDMSSWVELVSLPMDEWLWLDMAPGGVHRAPNLPSDPPPQVSHVWGWTDRVRVAVRLDPDFPSGLVGAQFDQDAKPSGAWRIAAPDRLPLWDKSDFRVSIARLDGFHDADGHPLFDIESIAATRLDAEAGVTSLQFLRLVPREP